MRHIKIYINKMQSEAIKEYKLMLKIRLLKDYKEEENYSDLLSDLTSANAATYSCWRGDLDHIINRLSEIERLDRVKDEDKDELQLRKNLRKNNQISQFASDDNFIKIILARNKEIQSADFLKIGYTNAQAQLIERFLLKTTSFKKWCEGFDHNISHNLPANSSSNHSNGANQVIKKEPEKPVDDKFLKDYKDLQLDNARKNRVKSNHQLKELHKKRATYIGEVLANIKKVYGNIQLLQIQLFNLELSFLKDNLFEFDVKRLEELLKKENQWIQPVADFFKQYKQQTFASSGQIESIIKIIQPIDTYKISVVCQNTFKPVSSALMVIGDTGVGKTAFILRALGYELQETAENGKKTLQPKGGKIAEKHKELISSARLTSTTFMISAFDIEFNKIKLCILDSPGFSDTSGAQKDVSNQIALEKAQENCKNICYLYLVDLAQLKGRLPLAVLSKSIANRFEYTTYNELSEMLLLIFNRKYIDKNDHQIDNIPILAGQSAEKAEQQYRLTDKQKIALKFITDSLRIQANFFDPFNQVSIDLIKSSMIRLKYDKKNLIKRNFDSTFDNKLQLQNQILLSNIRFYLDQQKYDVVKYYYDQLSLLNTTIQHHKTKIALEEVRSQMRKKVSTIEERINIFLKENIGNLKVTDADFESFANEFSALLSFAYIISDKDAQNRVIKAINDQLEQVSAQIVTKSNEEKIKAIVFIFHNFLNSQLFKKYLTIKTEKLEKHCENELIRIPKEMQFEYQSVKAENFDENYEAYQVFYQYYCLFAMKFPKEFNKLKHIKSPKDIITLYETSQEETFKKFSKILAQIQENFEKNAQVKHQVLQKLKKLSEDCQRFQSSKYISLSARANDKQHESKERLSKVCECYSDWMQTNLDFPQNFEEEIPRVKLLMANLTVLAYNICLKSLKDIFADRKALILSKLEESRKEFQIKLLLLTANINELDVKIDNLTILKNIRNKLKFYEACQQNSSVSLHEKFKDFKSKFSEFTEEFKKQLNSDFKNHKATAIIKIFKATRSLQRYEGISDTTTKEIETIQELFVKQLKGYLAKLKETILIKAFRSAEQQKKFNNNYYYSIVHFTDYVFKPCLELLDPVPKDDLVDIYDKCKTTIENICQFVGKCISLSSEKENEKIEGPTEAATEDQKYNIWLLTDFNYVNALSDFYRQLHKLNSTQSFLKFITNQNRFFSNQFTGNISETLLRIDYFVQSRYKVINSYITNAKARPKNINLSACQRTLKEVKALTQFQNMKDSSQKDISFFELQTHIYDLVNIFHDRHMNRMEIAINTDTMTINLYDCESIYRELKGSKTSSLTSQENIGYFIERLTRFVFFKCQKFGDDLNIYDPLDDKNRSNLIESIKYSQHLHEMISVEDISSLKIIFFDRLDQFALTLIGWIQNATEEKIESIKDKIMSRKFDQDITQIGKIEKTGKMILDFIALMASKKIAPFYSEPECSQHVKSKQIYQKIASLKTLKTNQQNLDLIIAEDPLSEANRVSLQDVYTHAKSEIQHKIKIKIIERMRKLYEDYKRCHYFESQKQEKVIKQHLFYIPQQIAQLEDYRNTFNNMRNSKVENEKANLKKLLEEGHSKSVLLDTLLVKLNEFDINQNHQLKDEVFRLIKQELSKIRSQISKVTTIQEIISTTSQKFWKLSYKTTVGDQQNYYVPEIESQFKNIEKEICQAVEIKTNKTLNYCQKIINAQEPDFFDSKEIQKDITSLHSFVAAFEEGKKVHFEEGYKKLLESANEKLQNWTKDFDMVCPIRYFESSMNEKDMNIKKARRYLKASLIKSSLYHILFNTLTKPEGNVVKLETSMEIEEDNEVLTKIMHFWRNLESSIKEAKESLEKIQFQQYIEFSNEEIELMLMRFDRQAIALDLYEQAISESKPCFDFTPTNFATTVKDVQKKLNTFVQSFLTSLNSAFIEAEKEIPNGLYFLEILFDRIDSNFGRKIFEKRQSDPSSGEMVDETYSRFISNPRKEFTKYIEECLNKLLPSVKSARDSFVSVSRKQHDKALQKLQDQCNQKCNKHLLDYQKILKGIKEQNQQNSPQLKQRSQQAQALYKSNKNAQEESMNTKKLALNKKFQANEAQKAKKYATLLLILKKLQFNFHPTNAAKAKFTEALNNQLIAIKTAKKIRSLGKALTQNDFQNYVHLLKSESKLFNYQYYLEFKSKTEAQKIDYVCQNLRTILQILYSQLFNNPQRVRFEKEKADILSQYNQFDVYFNNIVGSIEPAPKGQKEEKIEKNISKADRIKKAISDAIEQFKKADRIKRLAIILAVWSLIETSKNESNENGEEVLDEGESLEIRPHPVQVAALLLLTKTNEKNELKSQLSQVLTGEGKSIVLATLAIYFAKQDKNVVVSCYSSYLCERDYKSFDDLFTRFKVKELISYMTFNEICDKVLNNKEKNFKENIMKMLSNRSFFGKIGDAAKEIYNKVVDLVTLKVKNSILLIDQVDVFFEKEYFGNTYKPVLKLADEASKNFIKYVFKELDRNNKCLTKDIIASKEFKDLVKVYPSMEKIFLNQVYRMRNEFLNPQNQYFVDSKMIKYKDKDKLSEKLHFGYETIFAYCRQFRNNKISAQNYEKALFIPIISGQFSYSELPKYYSSMIGLSGTIEHLPRAKISFLEKQYSIAKQNMYLLPSIYGQDVKRKEKLIIVKSKNYNKDLIEIVGKELKKGRPVLVCFKSFAELQTFSKSKQFKDAKLTPAFLHEHLDHDLRDKCIKTVGSPFKLTLMTSQFSRGTDFIISDQKVKDNGGLHLILTYVPDLASQFIQFCGRTARQGQQGSFDVLLTEEEARQKQVLQEFQEVLYNLNPYMDKMNSLEDSLSKKKIEQSLKSHQLTQKMISKMQAEASQYINFLFELNKYPEVRETPIKIVIGVDGTGSMDKFFQEILTQLEKIMNRITELAKTEKLNASFLIQVVVYRNYNSGQKILEASGYCDSLLGLKTSLKDIKVDGGMGNESIQLLYRFVNLQKDVDMLILIGDAPPNTTDQVHKRRNDKKWVEFMRNNPKSKEQLYKVTNCTEQQKSFNQKFIVNGLYICGNNNIAKNVTENYFKRVASSHHGSAEELNFSKPNYSEHMVEFFTTKILVAANGIQAEDKIKIDYRNKFRGYTS